MADYDQRKVYSPDIEPYSFEGKNGILGTISYIIVAPIRLVSRVMHNIFVMPADLQVDFAEGLFVVAGAVSLLGLVDLLVWHKWVMLVSQLPLFPFAYKLRQSAIKSRGLAKKKRIVDVDKEQVGELMETIYDELDKIIQD